MDDSDTIASLRKQADESLYFFAVAVLGYNRLVPSLHLPLSKFYSDTTIPNKLVVLPRGYFKTTLGTVANSLHRVTKNSNIRILFAFNTSSNAEKRLQEVAKHVETNQRLQALYPEIIPDFKEVRWCHDCLTFNRRGNFPEGTIEAAGVSTDLASRHYNLIIEDDPVAAKRDEVTKEEVMPSPEEMAKGIGMHRMLGAMRILNDPDFPYLERLVQGTRWGVDDLVAYILENEKDYAIFQRSAEDSEGNSAYPEMVSTEVLHRMRDRELGYYMYASQMLLVPVAAELQVFHKEWLQNTWVDEGKESYRYIMVDPNYRKAGSGNKTGIVPLHVLPGGFINILPCLERRCEPDELVRIILAFVDRETTRDGRTPTVVIEDVAGQHIFKPYLLEKMRPDRPFEIVEIHPLGREKKDERIRGLTVWLSSSRIRFPNYEETLFVPEVGSFRLSAVSLKRQLLDFPFANDKDLLDALSYAPRVISVPSEVPKEQQLNPHSVQAALDSILRRQGRRRLLPMRAFWDEYGRLTQEGLKVG